jgi:hypothetical protein
MFPSARAVIAVRIHPDRSRTPSRRSPPCPFPLIPPPLSTLTPRGPRGHFLADSAAAVLLPQPRRRGLGLANPQGAAHPDPPCRPRRRVAAGGHARVGGRRPWHMGSGERRSGQPWRPPDLRKSFSNEVRGLGVDGTALGRSTLACPTFPLGSPREESGRPDDGGLVAAL